MASFFTLGFFEVSQIASPSFPTYPYGSWAERRTWDLQINPKTILRRLREWGIHRNSRNDDSPELRARITASKSIKTKGQRGKAGKAACWFASTWHQAQRCRCFGQFERESIVVSR
jgi:hypothetical protein